MKSFVTPDFWDLYRRLPPYVRASARDKYEFWVREPHHPSLQFKQIEGHPDLWSVRVTRSYRALCRRTGDECRWFWIGPHHEYDDILRRRRK